MKTFRYRLYPTQEQADAIRRTVGCVRYVYNGLLNDYKAQYNEWKKNGKPKESVPKLKEVTFLKETAPLPLRGGQPCACQLQVEPQGGVQELLRLLQR